MTVIELTGTDVDTMTVWSLMLFPTDEHLRRHFLWLHKLNTEIGSLSKDALKELTAAEIASLIRGPSLPGMQELGQEAVKAGSSAGDLLSVIYLMDRFKEEHDDEPSFKKALHVAVEFGRGRRFGDGGPLPISDATVRKRWEAYKPVSHLWAAARLNKAYPFCEDGEWFRTKDACYKLLEVAAGVQDFATAHVPKGTKPPKPVLERDKVWLIPDSIRPRHLNSDVAPDLMLQYLRSYEA